MGRNRSVKRQNFEKREEEKALMKHFAVTSLKVLTVELHILLMIGQILTNSLFAL